MLKEEYLLYVDFSKSESFSIASSATLSLFPFSRYQIPSTAKLVPIKVAIPGKSSSPKAYPSAYAKKGSSKNALETTTGL